MATSKLAAIARTAIAVASIGLASCSTDQPGGTIGGNDGSTNNPGGDGGVTNPNGLTALRIAPADPTLTVLNATPQSLELQLFGRDASGAEQQILGGAIWRTQDDAVGSFLDETRAQFTANGDRAGVAVVEAHYAGLMTTTTIKVVVSVVRVEGGAPPNADTLFGGTVSRDPASAPAVVYPSDRVMIPKNLVPMLLQWNAPPALDVFRATITGPNASASIYTSGRQVKLGLDEWAKLLESTAPGTMTLEVAGVSSASPGTVWISPAINIEVAAALMRGTIYYWALNIGRILRIRPGAENFEDFFTPPAQPTTGSTCVGCHTLSRDGRKMAFEYYGGWQTHGIIDVVAPNPPLIGPDVFAGNFSAFNPAGDRLLSVVNGVLTIRDSASGTAIEDLPAGALATHPAWSPDGSTIAYIAQLPGQPFADVDFFVSDLSVFRDANGARTGPAVLVPSNGMANMYPSFSPDSRLIAYGRGPYSRSHTAFDAAAPSALSPGDLFLVSTDGALAPIELARASARGQAFLPAFSPFSGGGVTWLAFFSRRDYGNVTTGSARRQIWVTAIDERVQPGADPSHPAFWLPAQDATTENMSAYWAPDPCHSASDVCTLDEDCCGGSVCRPDGSGLRRCVLREHACRELGEPCASAAECCPSTGIVDCSNSVDGPRCTKINL